MEYSNTELTQRVKQLELIVLDLLGSRPGATRGLICFNTGLHGFGPTDVELQREHPVDLYVPHYTYMPMIAWHRNIIHLHPDNHAT
jgi:hypothetical protein